MNKIEARKQDKSFDVEFDDESGAYCVFGDNSGFAYADQKSAFLVFWRLLNDIQKDMKQPELTYGDARDWWKEFLNRMGV